MNPWSLCLPKHNASLALDQAFLNASLIWTLLGRGQLQAHAGPGGGPFRIINITNRLLIVPEALTGPFDDKAAALEALVADRFGEDM